MSAAQYDVRKEAMQKMVENSTAPVELKRKVMRITKVEEDLNEMKVHNREMSQAVRLFFSAFLLSFSFSVPFCNTE